MQQIGPAPPLAPDGRLLVYNNTLAPATASAADATVVSLESGEARTEIDVTVRFVRAVRVAGVATGPSGPVAGVGVRLLPGMAATIEARTQDLILRLRPWRSPTPTAGSSFRRSRQATTRYGRRWSISTRSTRAQPGRSLRRSH